MNKYILFYCLFFISMYNKAQDFVPFKGAKEWYLYDKLSNKKSAEAYQAMTPTKVAILFVAKNNKWSAITNQGITILDFKYDVLNLLKNGLIKAQINDEIWLFTQQGKIIIDQSFLEAGEYKYDSTLLVVKAKNKKFGLINNKGKTIIPFSYSYAPEHFNTKYLKVGIEKEMRPLYGLLNNKFNKLIPIKYREIQQRHGGYFLCTLPNKKNDLIDTTGKILWSGNGNVSVINNLFLILEKENKYGIYFRKSGKTIWLQNSCYIKENMNIVICRNEEDNPNTFYNEIGIKTTFNDYDFSISNLSDKYLMIYKINKSEGMNTYIYKGFYDVTTNKLISCNYSIIKTWSDEIAVVGKIITNKQGKQQQKYGVINVKTLDTLIDLINNDIRILKHGFAVSENLTWQLYDNSLKKMNNFEYTDFDVHNYNVVDSKKNSLCYVKRKEGTYKNGNPIILCGFVNDSCREVIKSKYIQVNNVKNRYGAIPPIYLYGASIPKEPDYWNGSYAVLNKNFNPITFFEFSSIRSYWNGYITYSMSKTFEGENYNLVGVMDTTGNEIISPQFNDIQDISAKGFIASKNGRMCFLNNFGKELIPLNNERLSFINDTLLKAQLFDDETLYNVNGKEYFKPQRFKIIDVGYLNGTLIKVEAKSKTEPNLTELFYVDLQGKNYRD